MTKPIVAFQWLRVNGRNQKQPAKQTESEYCPQPIANRPKPTRRKFKNLFKRGSK